MQRVESSSDQPVRDAVTRRNFLKVGAGAVALGGAGGLLAGFGSSSSAPILFASRSSTSPSSESDRRLGTSFPRLPYQPSRTRTRPFGRFTSGRGSFGTTASRLPRMMWSGQSSNGRTPVTCQPAKRLG